MSKPRITFCINTRDRQEYLLITLSSLLSQTYQEWDLIIVDCSHVPCINNEAVSRLLTVTKRYGHDVHYEAEKVIGIPHSYEKMRKLSKTDFFVRQEDDIWMEPEMLERAVDVMMNDPELGAVGFMTPDYRITYGVSAPSQENFGTGFRWVTGHADAPQLPRVLEPGDGQGNVILEDMIYYVCNLHGGALIRQEAAEQVGGFCTHLTPTGHREETLFYGRLFFAGWNLAVRSTSRLWHFESTLGGSRPSGVNDPQRKLNRRSDEAQFQGEFEQLITQHPDRPLVYLS